MPELPEVETVCRGLEKSILNLRINQIQIRRRDLRQPIPEDFGQTVTGQKIKTIFRRAKYILLQLTNDRIVIIHLGMSGSIIISSQNDTNLEGVHDHLVIDFDQEKRLIFNDPRRFGLVLLSTMNDWAQDKLFAHLGPEPLGDEFTAAYLASRLKGRNRAIKLAILDQQLVVGVGNIYAAEALYRAGISPFRLASSLSLKELGKLVAAIRSVLEAAIIAGGSSLRDFVQTSGELGYFQNSWAVYNRAGEPCSDCSCNGKTRKLGVLRATQSGRSSYWCPTKQK